MKKLLTTLLTILLCGFFSPSFCEGGNSSYMSIDEYSRLFEMGFMSDEQEEMQEDENFHPIEKEKIDLETEDTIKVGDEPFKLNVEETRILTPYRQLFATPETRVDLFKAGKITLFSNGEKSLSDYMTNNFKSTMNISFDVNKALVLQAGHEVWYVNPNASVGAKKFYFNPRVNLSESCFLDYTTRYNQTSKNFEQEVGLNFKPKLFKDTATFGVKASTVLNRDTNQFTSKKLKFSTDFYIY